MCWQVAEEEMEMRFLSFLLPLTLVDMCVAIVLVGCIIYRTLSGKKDMFLAVIMQLGIVMLTGSSCMAIYFFLPVAAANILRSPGGVLEFIAAVLFSVAFGFRAIEPLEQLASYKLPLALAILCFIIGLFGL